MAEAPDYFLEIESHFASLRQSHFVFSAKDWALMKSWHDSGVPLAIVIEALDTVFQKKSDSPRRRVISSLSYCRHAVEELWNERKDLYVGKRETVPESDAGSQLDELAAALRQAAEGSREEVGRVIAVTAARVESLSRAQSVPHLEEELMAIEEALFAALSEGLGEEERAEVDQALARQMSAIGTADEKIVARTRRANERRLLRTRFRIPRLSLFS